MKRLDTIFVCLPRVICDNCGHLWVARNNTVTRCPKCEKNSARTRLHEVGNPKNTEPVNLDLPEIVCSSCERSWTPRRDYIFHCTFCESPNIKLIQEEQTNASRL